MTRSELVDRLARRLNFACYKIRMAAKELGWLVGRFATALHSWAEAWVWPWSWIRFRRNRELQTLDAVRSLSNNLHELNTQFKMWRQTEECGKYERPTASNRERLMGLDPTWDGGRRGRNGKEG